MRDIAAEKGYLNCFLEFKVGKRESSQNPERFPFVERDQNGTVAKRATSAKHHSRGIRLNAPEPGYLLPRPPLFRGTALRNSGRWESASLTRSPSGERTGSS